MSLSASAVTAVETSLYKVILLRNDEAGVTSTVYFTNDNAYQDYVEFLPRLNGVHPNDTNYVMWDLTRDCSNDAADSTGSLTYKLRYFKCDLNMTLFYDSLTGTNKAKNLGKAFSDTDLVLKEGTLFTDKAYLLNVLNGAANTELSSTFCAKN
eukprot:CAMPEP_0170517378 /NCGR_PEP_ID=MMETSP0209-20121228/3394_1 /TAXON_ID=665100 ORGANISM="Litonotus pictus, Strain P1" /NCGR_SAMPLE_ID=MMETSP0209 /ASSEMBLY_ACC=CAM_ASM_000301 /LENGTH=152 /DNA_ID=CAMNT_0010802609 /DNA_START=161 /DNA_END=619 /DNA_ORIENTATION=-